MKIGRLFVIAVMLMVASLTISAQSAPRDLQTELQKFWPDKADFNKNVWQLFPVDMSDIEIFSSGRIVVHAPIANRIEEFTLSQKASEPIQFDSDFYKLNFDKSAPAVKGMFMYFDAKYDTKSNYIGIIYDDRIFQNNLARQNAKNEFDEPCYRVSQADFEVANNQDPGSYDTGIPIIRYGANNQNNLVATPKMIVKIFKIGHPVGDFMEYHQGQKLEKVRLGVLDKTGVKAVKIANGLPNDYLYPFGITFVFSDEQQESYQVYQTYSGNIILAQMSFILRWQP